MGTSISGAYSALRDLLDAAAAGSGPAGPTGPGNAIAGLQILWGDAEAYEEQKLVAIGGIVTPDEIAAALGQQRREESYGIALTVKVHDPAATGGEEVHTTAFAYADGVRDIIRDRPTLNVVPSTQGPVRYAAIASQNSAGAFKAQGGGWAVFIDLTVGCTQRIS